MKLHPHSLQEWCQSLFLGAAGPAGGRETSFYVQNRCVLREDDRCIRLEDIREDFYSSKNFTDKLLECLSDRSRGG